MWSQTTYFFIFLCQLKLNKEIIISTPFLHFETYFINTYYQFHVFSSSLILWLLIICHYFFKKIYLNCRVGERGGEGDFLCWFIPRKATAAKARPGHSREPGIPSSRSLTWVAGDQVARNQTGTPTRGYGMTVSQAVV